MNDDLIYKVTDYILLNVYSLNSSGFYYGRAGVSLAFFEAARLLADDYLEEHAFELLQEALLYKGDDLSLHNGYSGISFVFHYLIENDFVEADVDELFSEQEKKMKLAVGNLFSVTSISTSTLSVIIDRLYLLRREKEHNKEEIEQLESFVFSSSEDGLESKLLTVMSTKDISICYADGLARWLLYVVYVESLESGLDVSRFGELFKLIPQWKK